MKNEKYKAAIETHKFYDTISQALIVGMISVAGVPYFSYDKDKIALFGTIPFWGTIGILSILLIIYRHCAYYANVARNVAIEIEESKSDEESKKIIGVSHALKKNTHPADKSIFRGIYGTVHLLYLGLVLFIFHSIFLQIGFAHGTAQTQAASLKNMSKELNASIGAHSLAVPLNNNPINITTNPIINIQIDPQRTIKHIKTNSIPEAKPKQSCPEKVAE